MRHSCFRLLPSLRRPGFRTSCGSSSPRTCRRHWQRPPTASRRWDHFSKTSSCVGAHRRRKSRNGWLSAGSRKSHERTKIGHHCLTSRLPPSSTFSFIAGPVTVLTAVWRRGRAGEMVTVVEQRVGDVLVFLIVLTVCVFTPPSPQTGLVLGLLIYLLVVAVNYAQHFRAQHGVIRRGILRPRIVRRAWYRDWRHVTVVINQPIRRIQVSSVGSAVPRRDERKSQTRV